MLEKAAELGLLTPADVEALDAWGGNLATKLLDGEVTEAEVKANIVARVHADVARRGRS